MPNSAMQFSYLLGEPGNDFKEVPDNPVIRHLEDRRVFVLVDGHDDFGRAHPGEVLDRARNADRDVQGRAHRLARLSHLIRVGAPPRIDHSTRCADRGASRESGGQLLQHLEVGRFLEPTTAGHDDGRFGHIERARLRRLDHFHDHSTRRPRRRRTLLRPAFGRSTGVNTFGLNESSAGVPVTLSFSNAFPAYTGRITVTAPFSTARSTTSCASGRPSRAATRGARSFPVALAANTTAP